MLIPNELAQLLNTYVDRNSERYCVNCCLKPDVHEVTCSDCDSDHFGLIFLGKYSGWNRTYFYSVILDQVCSEINSVGVGKTIVEEMNNHDNSTFSYNGRLYFTEDAMNVLSGYLDSERKVA